MNTLLITGFGLLALAAIVWQTWRERERGAERIPPEWTVTLGRIANDQALGHHRDARRSVLLCLQKLAREPADSRLASHVRISLGALMARDSVYPEVVRAIRSACAAEPAVSELAQGVVSTSDLRELDIDDLLGREAVSPNHILLGKNITDKAVLGFDDKSKKMKLLSVHPGVSIEEVIASTGFELLIEEVETTAPPAEKEIRLLREVIDPMRMYIK